MIKNIQQDKLAANKLSQQYNLLINRQNIQNVHKTLEKTITQLNIEYDRVNQLLIYQEINQDNEKSIKKKQDKLEQFHRQLRLYHHNRHARFKPLTGIFSKNRPKKR